MKQKNKTLYGAILSSFLFHIAALVLLQHYSLWFSSPNQGPVTAEVAWINSMNRREKDQILKEAFEATEEPQQMPSFDAKPSEEHVLAFPKAKLKAPSFPEEETPFAPIPASPTPLLALEEKISFSLPFEETFDLFEHLPKNLIVPTPSHLPLLAPLLPSPAPLSPKPQKSLPSSPPQFQEETLPLIYAKSPPIQPLLSAAPSLAKPFTFTSLPQLPQLPTLKDLQTASYSEEFDTEILFLEQEEEGTYLFALTLIPKPNLNIPRIRQHFTFLIDRSNSIQKDRLNAEKGAIKRALSELDTDDTFNIIAFDSKIEKLSPVSLSPSKQSFSKAKEFLDNLQLGSFFSPADLYKPLLLTVPSQVEDNELYTVILLTDGENLTKKSSQYALLRDWTAYNEGRVALFGIGINGDYHLATLDAMTAFNRGKLLYSPTKRGIKRKLLKLMKTIQVPIAKNLTYKAISRSPNSKIKLFSKANQSPHLYLNEPYVILGRIDSLDDFIIFIQGNLKDRWLNIKKKISFLNAKKGGNSLQAEWALHQAYQLYEEYLLDANPQHISKARSLLEPYNLQSAF